MQITELFLEARRNPEMNRKVAALDALAKYAGKQVFVSFTEDVTQTEFAKGSRNENRWNAKLGLNPRSEYQTPLGIYTYPIDYVLRQNGRPEFGGNRPFIWVIEPKGKMLDLASYSQDEFYRDVAQLLTKYPTDAQVVDRASHDARVHSFGGMIWNITREIALSITRDRLEREKEEELGDESENDPDFDPLQDNVEPTWVSEDAVERAAPPAWNSVLRSMGYVGVWDSKGEGIIHSNEPEQAVFFGMHGIRVLEVIRNIRPKNPYSEIDIYSAQPRALAAAMRKGMSSERVIRIIDAAPKIVADLGMSQFPAAVQAHIRDHAYQFIRVGMGELQPDDMGLDDEQTIALINESPWWATTLKHLTPKVKEFILQNPKRFADEFDKLDLTDEEKQSTIEAHPYLFLYMNKRSWSPLLQKLGLEKYPELVGEYLWTDTTMPATFAEYFQRFIITGPNYERFLNRLLMHDQEYHPDTYADFLSCFAQLPWQRARSYCKNHLVQYQLTPALIQDIIRIRPQCKAVLQAAEAQPEYGKWRNKYALQDS